MPDQVERRVILSAREAAEGEGPRRLRLSDLHRPQATEPVLTEATHCSHFGVVPDPPLWLAGLHPPRLPEPKQEVGSEPQKPGAAPASARPRDPPPTPSLSPVVEPPPPLRTPRTREIMSNMESILSKRRGATGPWGSGKGEGRGGGHAQGFDLLVRGWHAGARALTRSCGV